jgi:SHS2 domain-containing protein
MLACWYNQAVGSLERTVGGFRFLDHTADFGIEATGANPREAFAAAAQGLFAWITDLDTVRERESRRVEVRAPDLESLLVAFLNDLNYVHETQKFLFKRFDVLELGTGNKGTAGKEGEAHLLAVGYGEPVDPARHRLTGAVKSATYHMLQVQRTDSGCKIRVILDI